MRIASAPFCQRSTILLSSSSESAALRYKEKSGPELSPKLDPPCDGRGAESVPTVSVFYDTLVNLGQVKTTSNTPASLKDPTGNLRH